MSSNKITLGQFYTSENPFKNSAFKKWFKVAQEKSKNKIVLEPFAGSNNLIRMLLTMYSTFDFVSYDIEPSDCEVKYRDTINSFPTGYDIIITNPPYLAKNFAKKRKLSFSNFQYDNLYKHCLSLMLDNCEYVAAIIPASFINSNLFMERLDYYILLSTKIFTDTENPVCLALFSPKPSRVKIYNNDKFIGYLSSIKSILLSELKIPVKNKKINISFNNLKGNIGLRAIDGTKTNSIEFVFPESILTLKVKPSSRHLTRIYVDEIIKDKITLQKLNEKLNKIRVKTNDILLTPFKGLREDGKYRRRLDFALAKQIILSCIE